MKDKAKALGTDVQNLIKRCIKNDRRAQILLYERFAKTMFNSSFRLLKDRMEAEDIVQESFISAFSSLSSYKYDAPFEVWLRRIVVNRSLDRLRKKTYLHIELQDENIGEVEIPDHAEVALKQEKLEQIYRAAMELPEGFRIIFSLYYYEGFDHDEISEILGISSSTSRSQLSRAKQKIIKAINSEQ